MSYNNQIHFDFVKQIVVGFGFLEGLWVAFGLNPENEIFKILINLLSQVEGSENLIFIFKILPLLLLLINTLVVFALGKWWGIFSIFLAFIAGAFILKFLVISIVLLIIAVVIGLFAFKNEQS